MVTVQAVLYGLKGDPIVVSTCASRLNGVDAIEKAAVEAMYVMHGARPNVKGPRISYGRNYDLSIWSFEDHQRLYGWNQCEAFDFFFPKKPTLISWRDIPQNDSRDPVHNLEYIIQEFSRNKLRLFFRRNSPAKYAKIFSVYRAFSPDLIGVDSNYRYRWLGHPRYFELSAKLGLEKQPQSSNDLSVWPHPLP